MVRSKYGVAFVTASLALIAAPTVAPAATAITLNVAPATVARGHVVRLRGAGWGVIEFCKLRVTLTLKRTPPLKPLLIATVTLATSPKTSGTFATSWRVPQSVHPGLRTIVATQLCESGKNGAPNPIVRSTTLHVN